MITPSSKLSARKLNPRVFTSNSFFMSETSLNDLSAKSAEAASDKRMRDERYAFGKKDAPKESRKENPMRSAALSFKKDITKLIVVVPSIRAPARASSRR